MEIAARSWSSSDEEVPREDVGALMSALHACCARRIYNLALRFANDAQEAEDLTQDVFVRAIEKQHQVDRTKNPEAWLMKLAVRVFLGWRRKLSRRPAPGPLETEPQAPEATDAVLDTLESARRLLAGLSDKRRLVFLFYYYESCSVDEIADLTGLRPSSVRSHLKRGRKILRENRNGEPS